MRRPARFLVAAGALLLLAGCSTINKLTGQNDNTVLPGQREEAIPGRAQFPEKQDVAVGSANKQPGAGGSETYCAPGEAGCTPPGSSGDTFSDSQ